MDIQVVDDIHGLEALKEDWDELVAGSPDSTLPLSHAWIVAWWSSFGGIGSHLRVSVARAPNGDVIAIAPFMRQHSHFRRLKVSKMPLMANDYSPPSGIIVRRGEDLSQVIAAILERLIDLPDLDLVELTRLDATGRLLDTAVRFLDKSRQPFGLRPCIESPFIPICGDWHAFIHKRSDNFRKQVRKKLNRLHSSCDTRIVRTAVKQRTDPALRDITAISRNSWKRELGTHIEGDPRGMQFLAELCDRFGPGGGVTIWQLVKGSIPAAYEFHVTYDGVVYSLRADYRSDFADLSPGSTLECYILKTLFDESTVQEYNTCGHTYRYLMRWTDLTRRIVDIQIFPRRTLPYFLWGFEYGLLPVLRKLRRRRRPPQNRHSVSAAS